MSTNITSSPSRPELRQPERAKPEPNPNSRDTPRSQAHRASQIEKFTARLDKGEEHSSNASSALRGAAVQKQKGDLADRDGSQERGGEQSDFAKAEIVRQMAVDSVKTTGTATPAMQSEMATLERMAAQIAEGRGLGDMLEAEIKFPPGSLAQGAHIQRLPDGGMAIRITGMDLRQGAYNEARTKLGLLSALERRNLRVASLIFEKAGDQRGSRSTMSRVV